MDNRALIDHRLVAADHDARSTRPPARGKCSILAGPRALAPIARPVLLDLGSPMLVRSFTSACPPSSALAVVMLARAAAAQLAPIADHAAGDATPALRCPRPAPRRRLRPRLRVMSRRRTPGLDPRPPFAAWGCTPPIPPRRRWATSWRGSSATRRSTWRRIVLRRQLRARGRRVQRGRGGRGLELHVRVQVEGVSGEGADKIRGGGVIGLSFTCCRRRALSTFSLAAGGLRELGGGNGAWGRASAAISWCDAPASCSARVGSHIFEKGARRHRLAAHRRA